MKIKIFKKGDKVKLLKKSLGAIGWESRDWSIFLDKNKIYTVMGMCDGEMGSRKIDSIYLKETKYLVHANHFRKVKKINK